MRWTGATERGLDDGLLEAVLDTVRDHVAILDASGQIIATNGAWDRFAEAHGREDALGEGLRAACRGSVSSAREDEGVEALQAVVAGERERLEVEYADHAEDGERWFRMQASPLEVKGQRRVVVRHEPITEARIAAREREHAEVLLERVTTAIPQILWLVDADWEELLFASPDTPAFWGLPREQLAEDPFAWTEVLHPDDREATLETIQADMRRLAEHPEALPEREFRIVHGETGETRWVRAQVVPIVEDGELEQVAGITEDVTERKRQAQELERLAAIIEAAPQGVGWGEPTGEVLYMNESLQALVGLPETDDGTGHRWAEFLPEDELAEIVDEHLPMAASQGFWRGETQLIGTDGEEIDVEVTVIAHADAAGVPDWISVICRDIRAEKAARRAVEESQERFRELAEHVDEVFWLVAPDLSEIHYVSPGFEGLTGRSRDEVYASPQTLVEAIHPEDRERVAQELADLESGSQDTRYRIVRPDGTVRRVGTRLFPVRGEHGDLERLAGVSRDVTTEEAASEREQRRVRDRARSVELEQLVFATSHTLRTEVRRIKSFGQLLRQRAGPDIEAELEEPVREMLEGSETLELLHDALREYGEATRGAGAPEPVDLERLVREVLAERSAEIEGADGRATVGEIPLVEGHPEQLRTLVAELVDNAIKFRGAPPIEIDVTARDRGETVEVEVRDNGAGFDPAYAETIFGIFQQLEPSATEGVGIGLTICRRIVENHGGTIRADATPGEGAVFTFTLPEADTDQAPDPAP